MKKWFRIFELGNGSLPMITNDSRANWFSSVEEAEDTVNDFIFLDKKSRKEKMYTVLPVYTPIEP